MHNYPIIKILDEELFALLERNLLNAVLNTGIEYFGSKRSYETMMQSDIFQQELTLKTNPYEQIVYDFLYKTFIMALDTYNKQSEQ